MRIGRQRKKKRSTHAVELAGHWRPITDLSPIDTVHQNDENLSKRRRALAIVREECTV